MAYRFRVLANFSSEETKSDYCKGMEYTVRDGNDRLHNLVQGWIGEGKVEHAGTLATGQIEGKG